MKIDQANQAQGNSGYRNVSRLDELMCRFSAERKK